MVLALIVSTGRLNDKSKEGVKATLNFLSDGPYSFCCFHTCLKGFVDVGLCFRSMQRLSVIPFVCRNCE